MANFTFGIYPGGVVGTDKGISTGYEDIHSKIREALDELQGATSALTVRAYMGYCSGTEPCFYHPQSPEKLLSQGRKLDLVICFQSEDTNMAGWNRFITAAIDRFGNQIECLQITEEANVNGPSLDGFYQNASSALVSGVVTAKEKVLKENLNIKIGFNAVPDFSGKNYFWKEIGRLSSAKFYDSLDYIGVDLFPDVFRPLVTDNNFQGLHEAIKYVLSIFKNTNLTAAGINNTLPLHITENGWPTGPGRSYDRQAVVLNEIVRTFFFLRNEFNIKKYELFGLRDADSNNDDLYYQFGIMRHDYTPKPAFSIYKSLISDLTEIE